MSTINWFKKEAELGEEIHDNPINIYIVRHGETEFNADNKLRGWTDVDLNDKGYVQANELAKAFKDIPVDYIYVSSLQRAVHTAEPLTEETGIEAVETDALKPIDFGTWNGALLTEIEPDMKALQETWKTEPDTPALGGESFTTFQDRSIEFFEDVIKKIEPGKTVVLVAHLRNCVFFLSYALNGKKPLKGEALDLLNNVNQEVGTCSLIQYSKDKDEIQVKKQSFIPGAEEHLVM